MARMLWLLIVLTLPVGCGEEPSSHRVERTVSGESPEAGAGQARTKPPRAIATH